MVNEETIESMDDDSVGKPDEEVEERGASASAMARGKTH